MGTSNFKNHENGIFVVEDSFERSDIIEFLKEDYEEVTQKMIDEEIQFLNEIHVEEFFTEGYFFEDMLKSKGYKLINKGDYEAHVLNKSGKLVAKLRLESGYYEGVQLIVETDPYELLFDNYELFYNDNKESYQDDFVKSKLYEVYTPHNKTLFKIIEQVTRPLQVFAQFSNGETMYI